MIIACLAMASASAGVCRAAEGTPGWQPARLGLIPAPKECQATGREFSIGRDGSIAVVAPSDTAILRTAGQLATDALRRKGFRHVTRAENNSASPADLTIIVNVVSASGRIFDEHPDFKPPATLAPQGYFLRTIRTSDKPSRTVAAVVGGDDVGTLYGVYTLLKSLRFTAEGVVVRELQVADGPALSVRGFSPQWAWYLGERAPYDAALWRLDRWKVALDFMAEYRLNVLALCTYGKFPFPLERYRSRCAVDLPFELWNPKDGDHQIRWTHPAYEDDFLGELVEYAHARGIRVLIYSCLNLQDEAGSHQWTNAAEIRAYADIQQQVLKRYGIDGFLFESGEFLLTHPEDIARFGADQWSRLRADVFLTQRYTEAIRAVAPKATIGLVDHYLFMDWDKNHVPQEEGLTRWKAELPPETLVAYVHSPAAYDVFPSNRIWTYVFGPKGGLKPALQIHLADFCDVPRAKRATGAYYVTYDWVPHEPDYLCFAESAWGHYGGNDSGGFAVHSSEGGVGGPIGARVWEAIKQELYGGGSDFGEGLLLAAKGTPRKAWFPEPDLHRSLFQDLVPLLDAGDFDAAARVLASAKERRTATAEGLAKMREHRGRAAPTMVTAYSIGEHLDKAILLTQVQLAWLDFLDRYYETAMVLARHPDADCRKAIDELRTTARSSHARIRDALWRAYFSYPHDKVGKYEFLARDGLYMQDIENLPSRFAMRTDAAGKRLRLRNASVTGQAAADSNYKAGYYDPAYAIDGQEGTPSKEIWVSAETQPPHFLEVRLKEPEQIRGLVIHWVRDATRDWVAQDFSVRLRAEGQWQPVLEQKDNRQVTTVIQLDSPVRADQVRIEITRGSPVRPRLAAINEVQVLAIARTGVARP